MNVTEKRIKGAPQGWFVLFWSGILTLALSACDDKGKKIDFPEMKKYSLTEGAGEHVADVPYDEYLKTPAFTDDMYTKE